MISDMIKDFPLLFLLVILPCSLLSQELQRDSITQLEEVILLDSSRTKAALGIIPSTQIGPKVFQNYSPMDIVSPLNQIPGVYILSGAIATKRVTIRGVGARTPYGSDKVRLYFDGIPVTDGTGFSSLENFDPENLNSIEVIKGPKGTGYGSNLGGAILLKPKEAQEGSLDISNNLTLGSYNLLKNNLSVGHNNKGFSLGLQYGHMQTDGYRENSAYNGDGILLNTSYQIDPKNRISLLLNQIDYKVYIASSVSKTSFEEDPRRAAPTWAAAKGYKAVKSTLAGISYGHTFNDRLENTTSIFYSYLDNYEPRPFDILDEFTNGFGLRTLFLGNFTLLGKKAEYSLGAELYKDEYNWGTFENLYQENNGNGSLQGEALSENKEFRGQLNTFGTFTFPFTESFKAQVGLNINKTQYDFHDLYRSGTEDKSASRSFDAILSPSLTLNYALSREIRLFANISHGFSNPSLEETLTPDGVINPDIAQETGMNYELGGRLFLLDDKLGIDATLYRMDIKDLLVAQRVGNDQYVGKNAGSSRHQGLELGINYDYQVNKDLQITPFLNYTFSDDNFVDFVDGDNDYSGNPLTGVPRNLIDSGLQLWHTSGFYWNTTWQYVGEIPLTDANTLNSDAFNLWNTRAGYKKQIFTKFILGVDLGINNIADTDYASSVLINAVGFGGREPRYYYPGNGRNLYGSLQLSYKL